ncbi:MAG: hypothetical protein ACI3Z7_06970 [Candidatus Aphodosoma sp.]
MKHLNLSLAFLAMLLCACNGGQYDLELLSAEIKGFAPYSVGDTMTFATAGHDTAQFVVTEWHFMEPQHYKRCEKCTRNHAEVSMTFNAVEDNSGSNSLIVYSAESDVSVDVTLYSPNAERVGYSTWYENVLPGIFDTSNEEYTIPRGGNADASDYVKIVNGLGITEYKIDGILWKVVDR